MAIGDAVGEFLGTATENYQPSSGVEVQISSIDKAGYTDGFNVIDGSLEKQLILAAARTDLAHGDAAGAQGGWNNSSFMITNATYVKKYGTSDIVSFTGVQTNA